MNTISLNTTRGEMFHCGNSSCIKRKSVCEFDGVYEGREKSESPEKGMTGSSSPSDVRGKFFLPPWRGGGGTLLYRSAKRGKKVKRPSLISAWKKKGRETRPF